jgi:hypothetical protein
VVAAAVEASVAAGFSSGLEAAFFSFLRRKMALRPFFTWANASGAAGCQQGAPVETRDQTKRIMNYEHLRTPGMVIVIIFEWTRVMLLSIAECTRRKEMSDIATATTFLTPAQAKPEARDSPP